MLRLINVLLIALLAGPVSAETIAGRIRVIDGDTFDVGGARIRLSGIDALERDQSCTLDSGQPWACGRWTTQEVRRLYQGRRAECVPRDRDRYGRIVARCDVGGADLGEALVRAGLAQAFRRYSLAYVDAEKEAFVAGRGIWRATMQAPADYRQSAALQPPLDPACAIKGNVSGSGKIFHVPGQENYARTRINLASGERWFCTEAEARAAGWRKARR